MGKRKIFISGEIPDLRIETGNREVSLCEVMKPMGDPERQKLEVS